MKTWKAKSLAIAFALVAVCQSAWATSPAVQEAVSPPVISKTVEGRSFDTWLQNFRQEALAAGISQETMDMALTGLTPLERAIVSDKNQPEVKESFTEYRDKRVNAYRIRKGQEMFREHRAELERIGELYGVAPQYIVALWGMETNYGTYTGDESVVRALATMAWEGRREAFFKKELIAALRILEEGHITLDRMKGSWAGAMGQNQFMPSSFEQYAVDGDGDGHKDIWTNLSDVFASTANYLATNGWQSGERWGREVNLPQGFSSNQTAKYVKDTVVRPLSEWKTMGVTLPGGAPIPVVEGMSAGIITPDGLGGPAYLVYDNIRVFMRWNNSTHFATSVGLLADKISLAI